MCLNPNLKETNPDLYGRLYNCKFNSALKYLEKEKEETKEIIETLSRIFGNSGWIDGDLSVLVNIVLEYLGVKEDE